MSLVCWKCGDSKNAHKLLNVILEIETWPKGEPVFSYWLLGTDTWDRFQEDCRLQQQMFRGARISPPFLGKELVC